MRGTNYVHAVGLRGLDFSPLLHRLAAVSRRNVSTSARQLLFALLLLCVFGGAHLARLGTPTARALFGVALLCVFVLFAGFVWRERRDWAQAKRALHRVVWGTDPELGARALRALSLLDRARTDNAVGSEELAQLHFDRSLSRISLESVTQASLRLAARFRWATFAVVMAALIAFIVGPLRVLEGLNVSLAQDGRAIVPMPYLDEVSVHAKPPSYLRVPGRSVLPGVRSRLPEGTLLTVRGAPRHAGRQLVLSDGVAEVAFADDGSGGVVARWTLTESAELTIAARFGEVLVEDPTPLSVVAVADASPVVSVEGAPRTVKLTEADRIELRYEARDDYGLRQVDLVMRAGGREERRVLLRLDGTSTVERGGHALSTRDPWLRRMFLPIIVTIEARDDDPSSGSKWGGSEPITLVPPAVGAPEAGRFVALRNVRDKIVELLAFQMVEKADTPVNERVAKEKKLLAAADGGMSEAVSRVYGGAPVASGLSAYLLGQMRVLKRAPRAGESIERRTEEVLLAVEVALAGLATRDATTVAKRLSGVAEEAVGGAKQARETEQRKIGLARLDSAISALEVGASNLSELGPLGNDLGSVTRADLGRIKRARKQQDLFHAELAAKHLAARLARPNPSFGSARRGGVESGAPGMPAPGSGDVSGADRRFDQLAEELEELAREHAREIESVEDSITKAEQDVDMTDLEEEARKRAARLREALSGLPQSGDEPGSARASASLGREHAGSMAQSLERLRLAEAVQSGRDAVSALADAERRAKDPKGPADWLDEQSLREARRRIAGELSWAEQQLNKLRANAQQKAQGDLGKSGQREQELSRRAGNLAARGKSGETALPGDALDALERAEQLMREAARELAAGKGDRALELQRQAQRLLEQSDRGQTTDADDARDAPSDPDAHGSRGVRTGGEVPNKGDGQEAEEFRRRVLRGLSKPGDSRLSPAVRRYAEGLLQ